MKYRLKEIAKHTIGFNKMADIACDHAQLSVFVVNEGYVNSVIASDIVDGPLEGGKKNIEKSGLSNKINIVKADGLDSIDEEVDVVVIAGLGGTVIQSIIETGKTKLENVKRIILQPNVASANCRIALNKCGFKIIKEDIIIDSNIIYEIIVAEPGKQVLSNEETIYGPFILNEKNDIFKLFLNRQLEGFNRSIDRININSIPKELIDKRDDLQAFINKLKK